MELYRFQVIENESWGVMREVECHFGTLDTATRKTPASSPQLSFRVAIELLDGQTVEQCVLAALREARAVLDAEIHRRGGPMSPPSIR